MAARSPSTSLPRSNGCRAPERLTTINGTSSIRSKVVYRRPHPAHSRRRRMAAPSSATRESTTRSSSARHQGHRTLRGYRPTSRCHPVAEASVDQSGSHPACSIREARSAHPGPPAPNRSAGPVWPPMAGGPRSGPPVGRWTTTSRPGLHGVAHRGAGPRQDRTGGVGVATGSAQRKSKTDEKQAHDRQQRAPASDRRRGTTLPGPLPRLPCRVPR